MSLAEYLARRICLLAEGFSRPAPIVGRAVAEATGAVPRLAWPSNSLGQSAQWPSVSSRRCRAQPRASWAGAAKAQAGMRAVGRANRRCGRAGLPAQPEPKRGSTMLRAGIRPQRLLAERI